MPALRVWVYQAEMVRTEGLCDSCVERCRGEVARARSEWQRFMAAAPAYPERMFSGRGIVILAGGPKYLVPAWVNINMLRRTGAPAGQCTVCLCMAWAQCLLDLVCAGVCFACVCSQPLHVNTSQGTGCAWLQVQMHVRICA